MTKRKRLRSIWQNTLRCHQTAQRLKLLQDLTEFVEEDVGVFLFEDQRGSEANGNLKAKESFLKFFRILGLAMTTNLSAST